MKRKLTALYLALTITGSALRILPLQFLHPMTASADNSVRDEATRINLNQSYDDSLLSSSDINWYMLSVDEDVIRNILCENGSLSYK